MAFEYVYNGGGVAVADFNNDSLQDLFFTGNMVNNHLYLNLGKWSFRDVTEDAGLEGADRWSSGVAVVDINNDGWLDIYVCATSYQPGKRRANQLYVNQGVQEGGTPVFAEMAEAYGIADTSYTTNAAFFDYDNDGDLDLYLAINQFDSKLAPNGYWWPNDPRAAVNADKLYENSFDSAVGHPVLRDVSVKAGIVKGGFTLGMNIVDINRDGWKDIYVSNDYNSPDMFMMNNGDGTFTDHSAEYLKHTSYSSMGMNVADMNNDRLADIFVLDMLPEDNLRRKVFLQPYNYVSRHELRITPRGPVEKYRVNAGDVLFVSRGSRNQAAVVESVPEPTIASSTFYILHPHEGIDPGYLAWCLNQAPVQAQIGQVRTGAGTPIVQRRIFAEIRIPVPSLDQQRKLAVMGGLMAQELRIRNRLVEESKKLHCALGQRLLHNLTSGN